MLETQIDGKNVLLGLNWELLPSIANVNSAVRNTIKANPEYKGAKKGFVIVHSGSGIIGFVTGNVKGKAISGAGLLSAANRMKNQGKESPDDWLFVEKIDEDKYWFCAIKDGVPLPGTDIVESFDVVTSILEKTLVVKTFSLYTNDAKTAEYVAGRANVYETGFGALTEGVLIPKSEAMRSLGTNPIIFVVLIALLLAGGGGYFVYHKAEEEKKAQQETARLATEQAATVEAARVAEENKKKYELAVNDNYNKVVAGAISSITVPENNLIIQKWIEIVGNLRVNNNGWSLTRVTCDVVECKIILGRGRWTTNQLLIELFPTAVFDKSAASYIVKLNLDGSRTLTPEDFKNRDFLNININSDFQKAQFAGVVANFEETKPIIRYGSAWDGTGNVTVSEAPIERGIVLNSGYEKGEFSITGNKLWGLAGLKSLLNYRFFGVEAMNMELPGMSWAVKGSYLLQSPASQSVDEIVKLQLNPAPPPPPPIP